jgi:hypothetical protein
VEVEKAEIEDRMNDLKVGTIPLLWFSRKIIMRIMLLVCGVGKKTETIPCCLKVVRKRTSLKKRNRGTRLAPKVYLFLFPQLSQQTMEASFGLGVKRPLDRGTTVVVHYDEDDKDENSTPLEQNSNGVLNSAKRPKTITPSSPLLTKRSTLVLEEKEYSRNPPARGSFLTVTASSGNRVYLPLVSPEELLRSPSLSSSSSFTRRTSSLSWNGKGVRPQLLSAPISTLIDSVEQEQRRRLFEELQQEEEEKERADSSTRSLSKEKSSKSIPLQSPTENQLWVDKVTHPLPSPSPSILSFTPPSFASLPFYLFTINASPPVRTKRFRRSHQ